MGITVNGEPLPEEAIEFEYRRLLQFYSEHMPPSELKAQADLLRERAKQQAVGAKLLIMEAHRLDLNVGADVVDSKLEEMKASMGGPEAFAKQIAKQNATEDMVRNSISEGCKVDQLVNKLCEGISDPTEAEQRAHFEEHASEFQKPERAEAQHILIKPDSATPEDKSTAHSRILEIRAKLEEGASFEELAAVHSDCPSGKQTGGSLGWFGRGMMVPEFDDVVFSMDVGALSGVIETQFGYHVIHKTGHEEPSAASFDESRERIRDFMRHAARGKAISAAVNELRAKAIIEET